MNKSKFLLIPLLGTLSVSLISCGDPVSSTLSSATNSAGFVDPALDGLEPTIDVSSQEGYKYGRDLFYYYNRQDQEYNIALKTNNGHAVMPSRGRSKMLVVPVLFSDTTKTEQEKADMEESCRKAFFGAPEETYWHSVQSYFYEASYHQLKIEGEVTKCFTLDQTNSYYASKGTAMVNSIVETIYKALFTGDNPTYKLEDFDANGDGVIDSIYMIQEHDYAEGFNWAYTTWHRNGLKKIEQLGTYAWSSIQFMTKKGSLSSPDSHTYIHETGHLLGLNDYYDYFNNSNAPTGASVMQAHNICDHDPFSKYLFGWVSPKIITDKNTESSITVELKPFESSGDVVLLATDYNDTAFDEYLMIEYYTPTGINANDVNQVYEGTAGLNGTGVKVWHVDKRVYDSYLSKTGTGIDAKYTTYFDPNSSDDPNFKGGDIHKETEEIDYYATFSTNTSEDHNKDNFYIKNELELLRGNYKKDGYQVGQVATDVDLFHEGDTFGAASDNFADFEFYDVAEDVDYDIGPADWDKTPKNQLAYSFKVESLGDTAKIVFTRK